MQNQLVGDESKISSFLVKIKPDYTPEQVATNLQNRFPDNQILLTSQIEELYMSSVPALGVFLNVVIGVAAVISALVILLTMYTTVTERTRQIGIMKSLGMSNVKIGWIITQEALLISFCGIVGGVLLTLLTRFVLTKFTTVEVSIEPTCVIDYTDRRLDRRRTRRTLSGDESRAARCGRGFELRINRVSSYVEIEPQRRGVAEFLGQNK